MVSYAYLTDVKNEGGYLVATYVTDKNMSATVCTQKINAGMLGEADTVEKLADLLRKSTIFDSDGAMEFERDMYIECNRSFSRFLKEYSNMSDEEFERLENAINDGFSNDCDIAGGDSDEQ